MDLKQKERPEDRENDSCTSKRLTGQNDVSLLSRVHLRTPGCHPQSGPIDYHLRETGQVPQMGLILGLSHLQVVV